MRRLLHAVLLGLIGAGIVHIVVLLLVPVFSEQDAWTRLGSATGLYRMARFEAEAGGPPAVKSVDPLFRAAACRFDLGDGMVQVTAPGRVPFWSVSVYDRDGRNLYSFNDHAATDGRLDVVVLTPAQMIEVRKELPEDFAGSVFVEVPIGEGIVVVRGFVPDESWEPAVARFLDGAACESESFGD